MENHKNTDDSPKSRSILESQLRECFGRVAYSHKSHEKTADIYIDRQRRIIFLQIIFTSITTAGLVASFLGTGKWAAGIGSIISVVLLVLTAYSKESNFSELIQKHKSAAAELWYIREKYLSLLTDLIMCERPIESLQSSRDELLAELYGIYKVAPPTLDAGYAKAQNALKNNEELTFSNDEIDALLPPELKLKERNTKLGSTASVNQE